MPSFGQNCSTPWVVEATSSKYLKNISFSVNFHKFVIFFYFTVEFEKYRGGCVVCMDYFYYSNDNGNYLIYFSLRFSFENIAKVLFDKLRQFAEQKFSPSNGLLMGHSFGSQLSFEAGRQFKGKLGRIDGKKNYAYMCIEH